MARVTMNREVNKNKTAIIQKHNLVLFVVNNQNESRAILNYNKGNERILNTFRSLTHATN